MTREAAERFFAATGATVDQRLAGIAETARALLDSLEAGTCPHKPAAINRWIVRHLDLCARTFQRPPPDELLELNARHLLGNRAQRDGARKNRAKFVEAARYAALHPEASAVEIGRAIGYPEYKQIRTWMADPEFWEVTGTPQRKLRAE